MTTLLGMMMIMMMGTHGESMVKRKEIGIELREGEK